MAVRRRWSPSQRLPNNHINVLSRPRWPIIDRAEIRSLSLRNRLFSVVVPQGASQPDDKRAAGGTAEARGRVAVKAEASTPFGIVGTSRTLSLIHRGGGGDDAAFAPQPRRESRRKSLNCSAADLSHVDDSLLLESLKAAHSAKVDE